MSESYRIIDEPTPGTLSKLSVNPVWPLLSFMLVGSWLAIPWFIFNGVAVGSPTIRREIAWCVAGLVVSAVFAVVLLIYYDFNNDATGQLKYLLLVLIVWKLAVMYVLYSLQSHTIELYEYYGGVTKNGVFLLIVVFLFRKPITAVLYANAFMMLVAR